MMSRSRDLGLSVGNDLLSLDGGILEDDLCLVLCVTQGSVAHLLGVHQCVADGILLALILFQLGSQNLQLLDQLGILSEQRVVGKLNLIDKCLHVLGAVAAEVGFSEIDVPYFVKGKHISSS